MTTMQVLMEGFLEGLNEGEDGEGPDEFEVMAEAYGTTPRGRRFFALDEDLTTILDLTRYIK